MDEAPLESRILVMAKAPRPGAVKTRLRLAPDGAARLQEALIPDTVEKARTVAPVTVAVSPAEGMGSVRRLVGSSTPLIAQAGGDLGERMLEGARRLFAEGPALPQGYIREAVRSLLDKEGCDMSP